MSQHGISWLAVSLILVRRHPVVHFQPKALALVLIAAAVPGELRGQGDRPWVVIDTFWHNFDIADAWELQQSIYLVQRIAIRQPTGTYDTLDFVLATNPGWYSDSSLLLVALFHRLPPDSIHVPEVISYYEYLLPSATFRRAQLPGDFGTFDISPDGHYAARVTRDSTGIFPQLWRLPQFQVVGRGEYLTCLATDSPYHFEWTPYAVVWERGTCRGTIPLRSQRDQRRDQMAHS